MRSLILLIALCVFAQGCLPTPTPTSATLEVPEYVCGKRRIGRQMPDVPSLTAMPGSIFEERLHHNGIFVRTESEFREQLQSFINIGIPFTFAGNSTVNTQYCNRNTTLNLTVYVSALPTSDIRGFFEISWIRSNDDNFYNELYRRNGPGIAYAALVTKQGVSHGQMLDFLAKQQVEVLFEYGFTLDGVNTSYATFIRRGGVFIEIVTF